MYACNCFAVTENEVKKTLAKLPEKENDLYKAIQQKLEVATDCGICKPRIKALILEFIDNTNNRNNT